MHSFVVIASKSGFTAIHAAAETGQLKKIPVAQLTRELLLTRNDNGDTPLHAAAHEGHLDQVPPEFLARVRTRVEKIIAETESTDHA